MGLSSYDISILQTMVGISDEMTRSVLEQVKDEEPNSSLVPVYNLLLLENYKEAANQIKKIMEKELDLEYISMLQMSKFYMQRKAVPYVIRDVSFPEKKRIIKGSLNDPICDVVKEAVASIIHNNPFNNDEMIEIAINIYNNKYISVRVLVVDLLTIIDGAKFLLDDIIKSTNWRIRLRAASNLLLFDRNDQNKIINELKNDHIDEVRINLAKNLKTLEYLDLLKDPCDTVRAIYLENVVDLIQDISIFQELSNDSSWEVKKVLLNLQDDLFKKITIPIIKSNTEQVQWRIKYDILGLIEERIDKDYVGKLLIGIILGCMKDKVCEVRNKARDIAIKLVKTKHWMQHYLNDISDLVSSSKYLYRISVTPLAIEYDNKYKTEISKTLKHDPLDNVRRAYEDYLKKYLITLDYTDEENGLRGESLEVDSVFTNTQED